MPLLDSRDQSAIRRNLLASGSGTVIGLFFGVPPAWGAHTMGLPWAPYGMAVITMGLIVGLLIAFTVESLFPRTPAPDDHHAAAPEPVVLEKSATAHRVESRRDLRRRRLAEEKARLDRLTAERERRRDSTFGKSAEERIVWAELLELEMQDIDEQFAAHLDKGGNHERHDS